MKMNPKRRVFYSFHYAKDAMRAAQIRQIGSFEGNEPVSDNDWEEVKKKGKDNIERWIDKNMEGRSCLVVLVGEETAGREWVKYEIEHAWKRGIGVVGIYVHNIKDPRYGKSNKGQNPFEKFTINISSFSNSSFANIVKCYNPNPLDAYNDIASNLSKWVEEAIRIRSYYN